jgi:serine/threonine protein kinase
MPYSSEADIWSFGVLTYLMASGKLPFVDADLQKTMNMILFSPPTFTEIIPPELVDLISRMLTKLPDQRITLDDIKKHAWFSPREYSIIQPFVERASSFAFSPQDIHDCEEHGIVPASLRQSLTTRQFNEETTISRAIKRKKLHQEMVCNATNYHSRSRADSYNTIKPTPSAPKSPPKLESVPSSPDFKPSVEPVETPAVTKSSHRRNRIRASTTKLIPPNFFI